MFTNDLVNCIRNSNVLLYADDTVIYRNDFCFDRNYRNIQGDLNCLHKWCFTNGLTINACKTKVVNFGNNPKKLSINLSILIGQFYHTKNNINTWVSYLTLNQILRPIVKRLSQLSHLNCIYTGEFVIV